MRVETNTGSNSDEPQGSQDDIDRIVKSGPSGAFAVAGVATAIVVIIYFAFYFFAYLPRGAMQ